MLAKPDTRWGAFAIHLAISGIIFVVLAAIIVLVWYPGFLFRTDGGWQGIRLIAGIDLILGPLLTLIVYNRAKKSLPFDLAVIGAIQVSALAVGCWLVYQERPIAVIYADNTFSTMSRNSFAFNDIEPDSIALLAGQKKPVWIYVQDIVGFPGETKLQTFKRLGPPHLRTQKYQSLDENMDALFASGLSEVEGYEKPEQESLRFYRLQGRYFEGYLAFHPNKGLVDTIITNPTNYDGIQEG